MSDLTHVSPAEPAAFDGFVRVEGLAPQGQITLRGDFADEGLRSVLSGLAGSALPEPRGSVSEGNRALLWMSPDELLLTLPYAEAAGVAQELAMRLNGAQALVVNVSDARAHFRLTGPAVREVLAKLTPADMAPRAFPVGGLRRTRLGQIAAGIWMRGPEEAQVFCFRSVGDYAMELLSNAAATGGEVAYF